MYRQRAQYESIIVAVLVTGHVLNQFATSYTDNLCVISLLVLSFLLDIFLVGFLLISYCIPAMTCNIIDVSKDVHLSNIPVCYLKHITQKDWMCVINLAFVQVPGWFHRSKV